MVLVPTQEGQPRVLGTIGTVLTWSADSRALLVRKPASTPGLTRELWWVPIDGREPKSLAASLGDTSSSVPSLQLHPDGRRILVVQTDATEPKAAEVWVLENVLPSGGLEQ
jgi:hypothetical protein